MTKCSIPGCENPVEGECPYCHKKYCFQHLKADTESQPYETEGYIAKEKISDGAVLYYKDPYANKIWNHKCEKYYKALNISKQELKTKVSLKEGTLIEEPVKNHEDEFLKSIKKHYQKKKKRKKIRNLLIIALIIVVLVLLWFVWLKDLILSSGILTQP